MRFQFWGDRGHKGASAGFNAVWEGSAELQKVSENAVFGDSTPSGSLELFGDIPLEKLEHNEEYYIDLVADENRGSAPSIMALWMNLVYQSKVNPNLPDNPINFTYAPADSSFGGTLRMAVKNPDAVLWMEGNPKVVVTVRLARGRRSDAEIAVREGMIADWKTNVDYAANSPEAYDRHLKDLERQAAIARGEI